MLTFATWNIDAVRRPQHECEHIPEVCASLVAEQQIDFLLTTETGEQASAIARQLSLDRAYPLVFSDSRFGLFTSVDPAYVREFPCPVEPRSKTFLIDLPGQHAVLFTAIHGRDSWTTKSGTQALVLRQIVENVRWAERQVGHQRSILLGDFNVNPYADPALAFDGLHAIMSKREAAAGSRTVAGQSADLFYSPMFRLLDAEDDRPPATYYRRGSDTVEPLWHMLDQVVIRPALITAFRSASMRIVDRIGDLRLITDAGRPNRTVGSDHLPLVFEMDLRIPPLDTGGTNA